MRFRILGAIAASVLAVSTLAMSPVSTAQSSAATTVKVCGSKRCVTIPTSKYCPVSQSGCGHQIYVPWKASNPWDSCSASIGCVVINGGSYLVNGNFPRPTAAQANAVSQCAASIGVTVVSGSAGGPTGLALAGVPLTLWGCASV